MLIIPSHKLPFGDVIHLNDQVDRTVIILGLRNRYRFAAVRVDKPSMEKLYAHLLE
jgi:hypothetical protein